MRKGYRGEHLGLNERKFEENRENCNKEELHMRDFSPETV
jgi:hypothetical protein